jgi:PAS domain S-box-containing protein
MRLPRKTIGSRLLAMSALSSSLALLLACAAFLGYELVTFRNSLVADLTGDANAIAYNVTAPLLFDDPKAAAASLEALRAKPAIRSAVLRDRDGRVFATYGEADATAGPQPDGVWHRFERDRLILGVPVMSDGSLAGTLTLEAGLEQRDQRIRRYLLLSGAVLIITLIASLGISTRLHRRIVRPITGLTEAAERVSREADYSVRVETPAEAELGVLTTTFNEMLAMIEQQNAVLRASEARFKGVSESGIIGIVVSDLSGRLLEANDAFLQLIGLPRREFESGALRLQDLTPPDLRDGSETRFEQIKVQGTLRTWEKEYLRKDGGRVEVLVGAAMLDNDKVISFILDVTERKRLEQVRRDAADLSAQNLRFKEANRLKSEFLANMSHELRTPLNAILGFGELLYDGVVPPESPKHREFLGDIIKSGRHLLQLINDVLDLAKIEAGKLDFRPEPVNLDQLLSEVTGIVRSIAISKDIRTEVRIDASLKDGVFLDPARLKQIVYNFLSNALKFTPRGGSVEVRALPEGDSAFRLEVEDTGPGIAPEDIDKLFVEFQQLDAGAAKQHSGTGLGLALTRRLAEAQGGTVGVHSVPGKGSIFHVVLPRRGPQHAPQPRPQPRAAPKSPGAPAVLVIEDNAEDHALLVEALDAAGYAVVLATTGAQALALCNERRFDAITLDLLLPDLSGQEIIRRIRSSGLNRDVPVVVVTVVAEKGAVAGLAVNDFLSKPIDLEALLSSLQRAGARPEQPGSVMVVDDDPNSLKLMNAALSQLGYRAICLTSAEEALRMAERAPPSAVVLDLLMPTMDGFDFLERFRSLPANRTTPVLVWTVKDLDAGEKARLQKSAHGIIHKGERGIAALLEDLRRFLSGASAGREA